MYTGADLIHAWKYFKGLQNLSHFYCVKSRRRMMRDRIEPELFGCVCNFLTSNDHGEDCLKGNILCRFFWNSSRSSYMASFIPVCRYFERFEFLIFSSRSSRMLQSRRMNLRTLSKGTIAQSAPPHKVLKAASPHWQLSSIPKNRTKSIPRQSLCLDQTDGPLEFPLFAPPSAAAISHLCVHPAPIHFVPLPQCHLNLRNPNETDSCGSLSAEGRQSGTASRC
jgi:hypothetical protein